MTRKEEIVHQIRVLLDELLEHEGTALNTIGKGGRSDNVSKRLEDKYKGCMGGIMYLFDKGFFEAPRSGKLVSSELKKEGWHYSGELISMNLLALTRKRLLTRLEDTQTKGWVYVVRK